ncbi:hypothetical protein [Kribbella sp. HUAS MG21]|uniref:Uncharacterized protein n=1 Tax=Kribbella sp. HUAS MG21 TaxID=3160966 RepID=A0AAU7T5N1_9ACTN
MLALRDGVTLVSDQLRPRDTAAHRYEQNRHFLPDADLTQTSTSKAAVTRFGSGANVAVVPADPEKLTATVANGYYSPEFYRVSSAKYSSYTKTVAGRTTFDTLLLSSPAAADSAVRINRVPVGTLTPDLATALDIRYGDGGRGTYYKSWAAKANRAFGTYTFDGKIVYVQDTPAGTVQSLALYDGSTVKRAGKVLISSPVAVHNLAVTYDGTTLRIDGNGLTASTDATKAIGIAAQTPPKSSSTAPPSTSPATETSSTQPPPVEPRHGLDVPHYAGSTAGRGRRGSIRPSAPGGSRRGRRWCQAVRSRKPPARGTRAVEWCTR